MASRYSQEYFFQHSLMNISFRNLNEIIHPNAENIPDYIRHFASAVFVNGGFWSDDANILRELQLEAHRSDYIESYISYINMQRTTYNLVTRGNFLLFLKFICQFIYTYVTNVAMHLKMKLTFSLNSQLAYFRTNFCTKLLPVTHCHVCTNFFSLIYTRHKTNHVHNIYLY